MPDSASNVPRRDPVEVLGVLAHELVHELEGVAVGGDFRKLAVAIGLEGKMTATVAGPKLRETLEGISGSLGAYPHCALSPGLSEVKKQGTRLLKLQCACGYVLRVTRKWVEVGLPTCP